MPAAARTSPMTAVVRTPSACDPPTREPGADDDPEGEGQEREPGLERRNSSTRWMYSVLKKNIAKSPEATSEHRRRSRRGACGHGRC